MPLVSVCAIHGSASVSTSDYGVDGTLVVSKDVVWKTLVLNLPGAMKQERAMIDRVLIQRLLIRSIFV
jgi:hypothetical protein